MTLTQMSFGLASGPPSRSLDGRASRAFARSVLIGVGAAFDFHAGGKTAPYWMQRSGLEWLFRLLSEPRRLWKRYIYENPLCFLALLQALRLRTLARDGRGLLHSVEVVWCGIARGRRCHELH